jgi:predicted acyltransferase
MAETAKPKRALSLDALRGVAILLMILSGSVPFGGALPGWMYHAQLPPPENVFNPNVPGLTWVDLVFPFFLFAMGAAFPFALRKKIERGVSERKLHLAALGRGLLLAWFAIYLQHIKPYAIDPSPDAGAWAVAILGFALLFPMLLRLPKEWSRWSVVAVRALGYGGAATLLALLEYPDGSGFSLGRSDIIILVLANVAFFGTSVWLLTKDNVLLRIAVLGFLLAVRLTHDIEGSWNQWLWDATPFPWLYKFYYLQYLFVVIPGSIVGDRLRAWMSDAEEDGEKRASFGVVGVLSAALIVANLVFLYNRWLVANLFVSLGLIVAIAATARRLPGATGRFLKESLGWGATLVAIGLAFEAFEGGVKKDPSTISYYLTTAGLAAYALGALLVAIDYYNVRNLALPVVENGQNPMIAYCAGSNLILPVLSLLSVWEILNDLASSAWLGFLKGVLFTTLVAAATSFFTKKRLYWRT